MSSGLVCDAVGKRLVISFFYTGSRRIVEPHVLGYDHGGDLTLYAWQVSGCNGQSWRNFHFDKMHGIALTGAHFSDVRRGFNPNDWALTQVICCVSQQAGACWPEPRGLSVRRGACAACRRPSFSQHPARHADSSLSPS